LLLVALFETIYGFRGATFNATISHYERLATRFVQPQGASFENHKQDTNNTTVSSSLKVLGEDILMTLNSVDN
jgi:hypothetical protein